MNFEALQSFLAVSKHKSLSKAATALHITQPTLSTRIKKTENYFNVPLIERDWSGVRLTNHGLYLLPYAVKILSKLHDFTRITNHFKGPNNESLLHSVEDLNNTLRIGINNYLAPRYTQLIIDLLTTAYPSIRFEFFLGSTSNLRDFIEFGAVDCIIFYSNNDADFSYSHLIHQEEMVFAFSDTDYAYIANDITKLNTLQKPLLLNSNPTLSNYLFHFQSIIQHLGITQFQMVENMTIIRQLVEANLGYAAIPASMFDSHFSDSSVHLYRLKELLPTLSLCMTYKKTSHFYEIITHIYEKLSLRARGRTTSEVKQPIE